MNGPYKDKLKNLGGMAGNISTSGSSGGNSSSGGKQYGGLFGAFDKIYDTLSAVLTGGNNPNNSGGPNNKGGKAPGGTLANGGVPGDTGLDYMLKNMPGAEVTSSYKDEEGRPTPGEHGGIDIAAEENTPVPSPVSGTVSDAGTEEGYGNYVQVQDKNGNYHMFGHLNQHSVSTGDSVNKGSIVGLEGSTGHSTGPHVHYQIDPPENPNAIKSGPHLDPATYSLSGLGKFGRGKWGKGGIVDFINKWTPFLRGNDKTGSILSKIDSAKPKSPSEFRKITNEDIENITNSSDALELLKSASIPMDKIPEMNMPTDEDDLSVIKAKVRKIIQTIKPEKQSNLVDGKYEQNDIDYLVNNGYTKEDAIDLLSKDPKYTAKKTELEKKMDNKSFDLEQAKKSFDNKIKEIFNKNNTNTSQTNNTSSVQQQKVQQQSATPVVQQQNIDYSEKFDTMISLLATLVKVFTGETAQGNATGTGVVSSTANNSAADIAMANARNINAVHADELAKLFTNINNSMNALASR